MVPVTKILIKNPKKNQQINVKNRSINKTKRKFLYIRRKINPLVRASNKFESNHLPNFCIICICTDNNLDIFN